MVAKSKVRFMACGSGKISKIGIAIFPIQSCKCLFLLAQSHIPQRLSTTYLGTDDVKPYSAQPRKRSNVQKFSGSLAIPYRLRFPTISLGTSSRAQNTLTISLARDSARVKDTCPHWLARIARKPAPILHSMKTTPAAPRHLSSALVGALLVFPVLSQGALIVADSFDYGTATTTVNLNGQNGGTNGTGLWAGTYTALTGINVVDGALSYSGGSITIDGGSRTGQVTGQVNSDGAVRRDFSSQTGTVYFSFLYRLNAGDSFNDDFAQFFLNNAQSTSANNVSNVAIGNLNTSANFFGARAAEGSNVTTDPSAQAISSGVTYFLVGKVSKVSTTNYNTVELFVNPTSNTEPFTASATATRDTGLASLQRFGIRTVNLDTDDRLQFDELKIGTTFESVVVPEPTSAALGLLGAALLCLRRRRD